MRDDLFHEVRLIACRIVAPLMLILIFGCDRQSNTMPEQEVARRLLQNSKALADLLPVQSTYNFGKIVSTNQIIKHTFKIENSTSNPVRIVGAFALTPCCSSIDQTPKTLSPGEGFHIPVTFRPGERLGKQMVRFDIRTDSEKLKGWDLALEGEVLPDVSIEQIGDSARDILVGEGVHQEYSILCRRRGELGKDQPATIKSYATDGMTVSFVGNFINTKTTDGIAETRGRFVVDLPRSTQAGMHRNQVQLIWKDGTVRPYGIEWSVAHEVQLIPSAVIVDCGNEFHSKSILAKSSRGPFTITGIRGESIDKSVELSHEMKNLHKIDVKIICKKTNVPYSTNIYITTTCAYDGELVLPVLVQPSTSGGGR